MTDEAQHTHHLGEGAHDLKKDPPLTPEQAGRAAPANRQAYKDEERIYEEQLGLDTPNPIAQRHDIPPERSVGRRD